VSSPQTDYKQEVRFAVVMYGGVSLAIYINGVAQELLRIVRSTAEPSTENDGRAPVPGTEIKGTERVYRKLSYLLSDSPLLDEYRQHLGAGASAGPDPSETAINNEHPIETRFIVDILSGTSAGGINAIYLAKALANDQPIDQLKDLWVNEGDLALLLNDKRSVFGLNLRNQYPPQSLLNSRRMYFKLLKSLNDMEKENPSKQHFQSPYVDELDLFITATDIAGVPVPLRLSDSVVYERRHRNVFHFKYAKEAVVGDDFNDFVASLNPFLAFAARCTSSFPFAFEPMRLSDIDEILELTDRTAQFGRSDAKAWQRFFQEELDPKTGAPVRPTRFAQRSFGDGGYLDNKPFSYATEMLMHRQSEVPVDRKLIYIEPSPEHPEDEISTLEKPNALQNVKAAILDLPTYETIREDLQRVLERNQLITRVNRIISGIEKDVSNYIPHAVERFLIERPTRPNQGEDDPANKAYNWSNKDLAEMVQDKGRYFLPYRRLRVSSVTDDIARLITRLAGFDENSDQFLAIRHIVRVWRESIYVDYKETNKLTVNRFLWEFDLAYRLRRITAVRNRVDQLTRVEPSFIEELRGYTKSLQKIRTVLAKNSQDPATDWGQILDQFPQIRLQTYGERLLGFAESPTEDLFLVLRFIKSELNEIFKQLRTTGRQLRSPQPRPASKAASDAHAPNGDLRKNPLLEHIEKIGITPEHLTAILGSSNSNDGANQYEEDAVERARAILKQDTRLMAGVVQTAEALRTELAKAFQNARERTNLLFSPASPYEPSSDRGKQILADHPGLITSDLAQIVRGFVSYYHNNFDDYDQIRFPILYETEVGETDVVEVIRISPEDATSLINEREVLENSASPSQARHKLAGVSLHHFGAFLDRTWRLNDIMWGRLDGAERLITTMLPGVQNDVVRKQLIKEAQLAIVREELKPQSQLGLGKVLTEALLRASTGLPVNDAINKTLQPLAESPIKTRLEEIMRLSLRDDELLDFMNRGYEVNRQLEPKAMLNSLSRASQIIGSMFEQLANENGLEGKRLAWIARLGKVFWGLVEVAVPNSLLNLMLFHWLKVLYFFEGLMIIGSILLNSPGVQTFALKMLAVTVVVNLAVVLLRDYMRLRRKWQHILLFVLTTVIAILAIVGAADLVRLGFNGIAQEISNFAINVWHRIRSV
jgi:patatin-related protein